MNNPPTVPHWHSSAQAMFSVRIHSLDDPGSAPLLSPSDLVDDCVGDSQKAAGTSRSTKPNPKVQLLRGIVHLYRTLSPPLSTSSSSSSTTPQVSSDSTLPVRFSLSSPFLSQPAYFYDSISLVARTRHSYLDSCRAMSRLPGGSFSILRLH